MGKREKWGRGGKKEREKREKGGGKRRTKEEKKRGEKGREEGEKEGETLPRSLGNFKVGEFGMKGPLKVLKSHKISPSLQEPFPWKYSNSWIFHRSGKWNQTSPASFGFSMEIFRLLELPQVWKMGPGNKNPRDEGRKIPREQLSPGFSTRIWKGKAGMLRNLGV